MPVPPKGTKRPDPNPGRPQSPPAAGSPRPPSGRPNVAPPVRMGAGLAGVPPLGPNPAGTTTNDIGLGVAVEAAGAGASGGGTVTARRAGGLRDLALEVDPRVAGLRGALQHLAKAVNIAFQSDYGENYLESVYQAAIVRNGEVQIVHREFFGFRDSWFGQFGRLLESMKLSFEGPDPASPEGRQRFEQRGPASIRGLFNLIGRKLDLVAEFEDRVPAFVEQMFDRLEASGIINGWNREDWTITTTTIGLDVRIRPRVTPAAEE